MNKSMKKDVLEEYVLIASMIKWLFLSVIIGLVVGGATAVFIKLVGTASSFTHRYKYYYLFMPLAFFLSSYIVLKLAPEAKGHGTEKAIEAVNKNSGKMNIKVVPVKLLTTLITIIFGGSVGMEGPATQIGAGISSKIGEMLKLNDIDRKRVVVCGIASGFVGVFGSPVGAAVFAAEVLYIGQFSYLALFPSLISAFVSFFIGRYLGTKPLIQYFINMKEFSTGVMLLRMIVFGIFIGVLAMFFIRFVNFIENCFKKINIYAPLKGIIGGLLVILVVLITGSEAYMGIGEEVIERAVQGQTISPFASLWKTLTTSITLGSGGSGGILTPMLYVGATAGSVWSHIVNGSATFYAAVGMVSFLASCANTPLAGIVMSMELFGSEVGMYAAIVCVISYLIVGHKSIYPTQIIVKSKTPSLFMDTDCEIGKVDKRFIIKNHILKKIVKDNINN
ncbi:chloride channel protein [Clostridium lundense]|uniref:chloride channel protein n=1 Tax=Clostridium lundense TaxID=319475 RepID=UPI000486A576|nr:chloride channel protein [Clostridium lundense]